MNNVFTFKKMRKAHLWRCYDGKELEHRRCIICGQHINNSEYYTLIIDNGKFRGNYLLHLDDFVEFLNSHNIKYMKEIFESEIKIKTLDLNYWDILSILYNIKTPKLKNLNKEDKHITEMVKECMHNLGFSANENNKSILFTNNSKVKIKYLKKHKYFSCTNKLSCFDKYFLQENLYKKIKEELLKKDSDINLKKFLARYDLSFRYLYNSDTSESALNLNNLSSNVIAYTCISLVSI